MNNIVPVQFKPDINNDLVEMLEELLDRAKSGDLRSGNFSGTSADGTVTTTYSSSENVLEEIAAVARLLHRLHIRADEALS